MRSRRSFWLWRGSGNRMPSSERGPRLWPEDLLGPGGQRVWPYWTAVRAGSEAVDGVRRLGEYVDDLPTEASAGKRSGPVGFGHRRRSHSMLLCRARHVVIDAGDAEVNCPLVLQAIGVQRRSGPCGTLSSTQVLGLALVGLAGGACHCETEDGSRSMVAVRSRTVVLGPLGLWTRWPPWATGGDGFRIEDVRVFCPGSLQFRVQTKAAHGLRRTWGKCQCSHLQSPTRRHGQLCPHCPLKWNSSLQSEGCQLVGSTSRRSRKPRRIRRCLCGAGGGST